MDKTSEYRKIVVDCLKRYASLESEVSPDDEIEEQLLLDTEHDHYQILTIGWEKGKRVYYPVFHLDIKNGKIWVQEDATDFDIVGELERRGVSKHDIVLAFHSPAKRRFSAFAVA